MKLARLDAASDASDYEREIAREALARTVDVMLGKVEPRMAHGVLMAANYLRKEICALPTQ